MNAKKEPVVVFEEREATYGTVAFARLNVPQSLNTLDQVMVESLDDQLTQWGQRDDIACVVLHSSGSRAFCAGGNVVKLYQAVLNRDRSEIARFFEMEYRLDHRIHTYPKPLLCWGQGVVMGGGMGLLAGASHRVVTPDARLAMPEISIGMFPDVGATWFLGRLPGQVGRYLGLTASSINAGDARALGLADYCIDDEKRRQVFDALLKTRWRSEMSDNHTLMARLLRTFHEVCTASHPEPYVTPARREIIEYAGDGTDVESFYENLAAKGQTDTWLEKARQSMEEGSPLAQAVTNEQLIGGRHLSLAQVFMREYNLAMQMVQEPDYAEGIRALLVDKDRRPHWSPKANMTTQMIKQYFEWPAHRGVHPLSDLSVALGRRVVTGDDA